MNSLCVCGDLYTEHEDDNLGIHACTKCGCPVFREVAPRALGVEFTYPKRTLGDYLEQHSGTIVWIILVGLVVILVGLLAYSDVQEESAWKAFAIEHHCRVAGAMTGSVTQNGDVIPEKTGYLCDDERMYWR